MTESTTNSNTHLLLYPFPSSGHIIPILDLIHHLLRRSLTITVILSPATLPLLHPLHYSSLHTLIFPDPKIPPSSHPLVATVVYTQKQFDPIVTWFQSHPSPPVAIISDFFLGWTSDLASNLGIPRVVFSPSGALGSSVFYNMWRDVEAINAGNADGDEYFVVSFPEIPNSPEFCWWEVAHTSRYYKTGDPDFELFREGLLGNMRSWGMIYNTFEGMEGGYINYLKKQTGHDRVWAVGPLLPDAYVPFDRFDSTVRGGPGGFNTVPPDDLIRWLDSKSDDSVVFVCFGSRNTLSEKEMSSLASALELSSVDFVLCVKESDSGFIPSGFEARVGGRGFVVKGWAPQRVILKHRAVGSFVTHCGWNSTLEGVAAGVMMLAWPMDADQFVNAMLVVDQLGVGKRVCVGGPESVPDSVELARLLDESMSGDIPERVEVKKLSEVAMKAVKEGTSIRDLNMFVDLLSSIS